MAITNSKDGKPVGGHTDQADGTADQEVESLPEPVRKWAGEEGEAPQELREELAKLAVETAEVDSNAGSDGETRADGENEPSDGETISAPPVIDVDKKS